MIKNKISSLNYQTINCNNNSGIVVFDQKPTASIDKFRNTEFNISRVEVINLRNKQLITSMNLTPDKQSIHFDFTLDHVTPIKLTIQESPQSQLTVNDITVGKYH